jgi:hypothetical protein
MNVKAVFGETTFLTPWCGCSIGAETRRANSLTAIAVHREVRG